MRNVYDEEHVMCFGFFKLARATVRDPKTGVLTTANYRVSKR